MSDQRFDGVVTTVRVEYDGYEEHRPGVSKAVRCQALCATCGTYRVATMDELAALDGETELRYVDSLRAWNCCHEGVDPLDGYPEEPDSHRIDGPDASDDS